MGRIAVITNPHAKGNRSHPDRAARLASILGDRGAVFETTRLDQIADVCREALAMEPDLLCFCGGDGTNHLVLSALIPACRQAGRALPALHFLRGGSMNTVGWSIGLRCTAEKALAKIVELHGAGRAFPTTRLGTLAVDGRHGFLFGDGYAFHFLEEYYAATADSGPRRAMEIVSKAITATVTGGDFLARLSRTVTGRLAVDGREIGFPAYGMILAGFTEYLGVGFKSLYRAREREGFFHVVATALPPMRILAQLHRFFTGKPLQGKDHFDALARELVFEAPEPEGYFLDGELYAARELVITPGPVVEVAVV